MTVKKPPISKKTETKRERWLRRHSPKKREAEARNQQIQAEREARRRKRATARRARKASPSPTPIPTAASQNPLRTAALKRRSQNRKKR